MATEIQENNLVLSIKNLTFGYSKDKLLYKDFNFELKKGEVKAIVGESGSGKSTLFELITNELKPLYGTKKQLKSSKTPTHPFIQPTQY